MIRISGILFLLFFVTSSYSQKYFFGDIQSTYNLEKEFYSSADLFHTISKPYLLSKNTSIQFQTGLWKYASIKDSSSLRLFPFISLSQVPRLHSTNINYRVGLQLNYNKSSFSYQIRIGYLKNYMPSLFEDFSFKRLMMPTVGYLTDSSQKVVNQFLFHGVISYKINNYIVLSAGNQKNKFGDGYRSLWLSEFAPTYPFLKLESTFWKVKYVNLWSVHDDKHSRGFSNKKWASSHLLSYNITNWLNLSLFESVIWQDKDTLVNRGPDINYFNPFIFFRPVEYGIGSADNSLLGAGLKWSINKKIISYSSFILDEFLLSELRGQTGWWGNKYGIQFGIKLFDLFKIDGLYSIAEYNLVRPYTYSHMTSKQNYGHKNHSLAHPLESNFKEFLMIFGFQKNNLDISLQYHSQLFGLDSAGINFGGNMFNSYVDRNGERAQFTGQGNLIRQNIFIIQFSYLLAFQTNTKAFFRFNYRNTHQEDNLPNNFILFNLGISSRLWQNLQDY